MPIHNKRKFLVREYMRSEVKTAGPNTSVREAIEIMICEKTNGLVVIDQNKKVVGMLSGWDIIKFIVPQYLSDDKHLAYFESGDLFEKRIKSLADSPISECMTCKKVHTISPDRTLMEAITILSEFHIRQLPVVNDDNILLGYINRTDIKNAIGDVLGLAEKLKD